MKMNLTARAFLAILLILSSSVYAMPERRSVDQIVVLGKIQKITIERAESGIYENSNDEIVLNNSCGTYEILIDVDEVIIGNFSVKKVIAKGVLSEWCELDVKFIPESNIFYLKKRKRSFYVESHIPLYEVEQDGLAALPGSGEVLGGISLIQEIDFSLNQGDIYIDPNNASEFPKEWIKKYRDSYIYKVGIPYKSIKSLLQKSRGHP